MALLRTSLALLLSVTALACSSSESATPGGATGTTGAGGGGTGGSGTGGVGGGTGGGGASVPAACGDGVKAAALETGSYDARFTIPGFTGPDGITPIVYDFAEDVDGSLVAAGRFQWFEGATVPPLMRWKNGEWKPARDTWEIAPPPDGFSAIAIAPDGALALATADSFGDKDGEIWVDDGSGLTSIGSYAGQVRSLAYFEGKLWVAGVFELDAGGNPIDGLAVWDGTQWSAPPGGALLGSAFELLVDGGTLYVGGAFTEVGGIAAANVAAYDGTGWAPYDFPDALLVYALARTESGALYAGGAYGDFQAASGIARWDGSGWQTVGGGLGQLQTRGVVTDLVAHGDTVDVTGCFSSAGGLAGAPGAVPSRGVARWTGSAWQSLDDDTKGANSPWFQPGACGDEGPEAIWDVAHQRLAFDDVGSRLFAGGSFAGIGGVLSQSIVAHDGSQWIAQGKGGLGVGGSIDRIAVGGDGCDVYGAGTFTHVGGEPAKGRVVHFNGTGWESLSDSLPKDAWCPALDVSPAGDVELGCMLFPPEGDAVGTILHREGDAMVPLDLKGLGPVAAIAHSPSGTLWIAGAGATGFLARLDGDTLTTVEAGFDGVVNLLDVTADDDLLVGGSFTHIGDVAASRVAHWDGKAWSPLGDGLPGQALALAQGGNTVYASSYDEGQGAFLLGAFDGSTWKELATPEAGLTPQSVFSFNRIRPVDGGLVLGGTAVLDDGSGRGVLVYRDGKLHALGGGVGSISIDDLEVTSDAVWVAGPIGQAGPKDAAVSSVGVARFAIGAGE